MVRQTHLLLIVYPVLLMFLVGCSGESGRDISSLDSSYSGGNSSWGDHGPLDQDGWTQWSEWTQCFPPDCVRTRWRTCPGMNCPGQSMELENCSSEACFSAGSTTGATSGGASTGGASTGGASGGSQGGDGSSLTGCPASAPKLYRVVKRTELASEGINAFNFGLFNLCYSEDSCESCDTSHCISQNNKLYCKQTQVSNTVIYKRVNVDHYKDFSLLHHFQNLTADTPISRGVFRRVLNSNICGKFSHVLMQSIPERERQQMQALGLDGTCSKDQNLLCELKIDEKIEDDRHYIPVVYGDTTTKSVIVGFIREQRRGWFNQTFDASNSRIPVAQLAQYCVDKSMRDAPEQSFSLRPNFTGRGYRAMFSASRHQSLRSTRLAESWVHELKDYDMQFIFDPIPNVSMGIASSSCPDSNSSGLLIGVIPAGQKPVCSHVDIKKVDEVLNCQAGQQSSWRNLNNEKFCIEEKGDYYYAVKHCIPCLYGGSFDSKNCLLGYLPSAGFVDNNKFYYHHNQSNPDQPCREGDVYERSRSRCYRPDFDVPPSAKAFVHAGNSAYYQAVCRP